MPTENDPYDLAVRIAELDDEARAHLQLVLATIVNCYGDADGQAVVVYAPVDSTLAEIITINCTDMDAAVLVRSANSYLQFLNIKDAPAKEKFN